MIPPTKTIFLILILLSVNSNSKNTRNRKTENSSHYYLKKKISTPVNKTMRNAKTINGTKGIAV